MASANGRAYVGSTGHDLLVLDVSDPASPVALAAAITAGALSDDLIVDGPIVHVTTSIGWISGGAGAGVLSYLVYVPGDINDDGVIDELDFNGFESCFTGPGSEPADTTCLIFDFDEDNDVDCDDWAFFRAAWSGPDPPLFGPCHGIPGDVDGDWDVDVNDFLLLLAAWGSCAPCSKCPADFDGDCTVNVNDFLIMLANWG